MRRPPGPLADDWPRPPIEGVTALLQPVAHVLLHLRDELPRVLAGLSADDLWARPGGVPSIGYHLAHLAGNIERLFTHARGRSLSELQRQDLVQEGAANRLRPALADLLGRLDLVLDDSLELLRELAPERLLDTREVGRDGRFVTVFDLLSSAMEHATRHLGQIATTATFLRGFGTR